MWKLKNPNYGDHIRVDRGMYFHHGIYESDDVVYHFASPIGQETSPDTAIIHTSTLANFLKGGLVMVREYTNEELDKIRDPEEIIEYARAHLGEGGYNLISNNCEHFANLCVFGESKSSQVDDIFQMIMEAIKWE